MREIEKVLESNEKVLWEGTPAFWPFFGRSLVIIPFGLFFLAISSVIFSSSFGTFPSLGFEDGGFTEFNGSFMTMFSVVSVFFFLISLSIIIGPPAYTALVHKKMYYVITDKRVMIQSGIVGRDFKIIDFDQISNVEVNVGFFDKLFGGSTGSINVMSPGNFATSGNTSIPIPHTIANIKNPYEVFKFFKKVVHDVKTDIHYPNKYRPNENPGYNTEYKPRV